jgi:small subunit ribosomal protein S20
MVQQATAGAKKKKKVRHPSAEKRARQSIHREAVNRARRSRMRTAVKNVELALAAGDKATAQAALKLAQPELDHAVSAGVLKRATASRKLSRLNARVNAR